MQTRVFIRRNIEFCLCPECRKISTLRKSKSRNFIERTGRVLGFRVYKCQDCGWRGKVFKYKFAKKGFRALLLYIVAFALSAYITVFAIKKYFIIEPSMDVPTEVNIDEHVDDD